MAQNIYDQPKFLGLQPAGPLDRRPTPRNSGWSIDAAGRRTWPVDAYSAEGPRSTDWLAQGVIKQHRIIGTYLNLLGHAGFSIGHVQEWAPTDEQVAARPELAEERERPMLLLVAARR